MKRKPDTFLRSLAPSFLGILLCALATGVFFSHGLLHHHGLNGWECQTRSCEHPEPDHPEKPSPKEKDHSHCPLCLLLKAGGVASLDAGEGLQQLVALSQGRSWPEKNNDWSHDAPDCLIPRAPPSH